MGSCSTLSTVLLILTSQWWGCRSISYFITDEPAIEGLVQATLQEHRAGNVRTPI